MRTSLPRLRLQPHQHAAPPGSSADPRVQTRTGENAARHDLPGGPVRVATSAGPDGSRLQVENDGPHISASQITALTERFRGGVSREAGHGLGLVIARMVAEMHGGRLDIRSRSGGGPVVVVDLPARSAHPTSSVA
jgi:two-component system sensor histidine kinase VanS